jgi:hypothetical protein
MTTAARIVLALVALILVLMVAKLAAAQEGPACAPRDKMVAKLADKFGETLQSLGVLGEGVAVLEVYRSEESGTWTILETRPDGNSCLMAAGSDWITPPPAPKGDPA